jgi:ribose 1,5-bisphosphate isomerase
MPSNHPAIQAVVERVHSDAIGGAADTAKEVVRAMASLVADSTAKDGPALIAQIDEAVMDLLRVLPSLAPPINALHRLLGGVERAQARGASARQIQDQVGQDAGAFLVWADKALEQVGQYGAEKVLSGTTVFMYSMSSTVWRIFRQAKAQGREFRVMVTESRPAKEGLWTVTEMEKYGIPVSVSIDACVGELIPSCQAVFVGADVISSTGHALCKVGTYPTALVAKARGVPFYVAADTLKFDTSTLAGLPYRNEAIRREEVLDQTYPAAAEVVGHIFDETPPELISAIITEKGFLHPTAAFTVMQQMEPSEKLLGLLPAWSRGEL